MSDRLAVLPVRLLPKEGEGVRGYLQRLVITNGLTHLSQLGKINQLRLEDLTILLDRDDSRFWRNHQQAIYWEKENALKKVQWNWTHRRCCPKCLMDEMVWPIEWELRGLTVCRHHSVRLIDTCPSCQKKVSWKTTQLTHCGCGNDLRTVKVEECSIEEAELAKAAAASVGSGVCPGSLGILRGIPTAHLFKLIYFIGKFGLGQNEVKVSSTILLDEVAPLFKEAAFVVSNWPHNYHDWITRLKGEKDALDKGMGIPEVFGKAYTYMYRNLHERPYNFMRREFEDYLLNNWSWPLNNRNKRIPHDVREDGLWITVSQVSEDLKTGKQMVEHLIKDGLLEARIATSRKGRIFVAVNRNDLGRARKHLADLANLSQAVEILGISEERVLELYDANILKSATPAQESVTGQWQFKVSELRLISVLGNNVPLQKQANENQYSVKNLLKSGLRGKDAFANLLREILNRNLTIEARVMNVSGISGWLLNRDAYEKRARELLEERAKGFTVQEAAVETGVKETVIYALVNKGLIRASEQELRGRKLSYISPEQLEEFKEKYVFGTELAGAYKTSPRRIIGALRRIGIGPVAGPGVDNCRQVLFERNSIDGLTTNIRRELMNRN